jgi:NAD(P)-dependent dehydrogenase (short-subunit alcohol dehydrogenase family)
MSELIKTALVTGGTRGIGKAIVKKLAGLGYQVYFTYVSRPELAETVCAEVAAEGGTARGFLLDASDWDAVADFFAAEIKDKVCLEVLVNNAGITKDGLIMRMKREQWEQVIQINLTGAFVCLQQAAKIMLKQRKGTHCQYFLCRGTDGQCRAIQLLRVQGRPDRVDQGRRPGTWIARRHRQRHRTGVHRDRHD